MARYSRLFLPNTPLHIVQRGHDRNVVFSCDADYSYYVNNLRWSKTKFRIKVFGYCLMTNHVHLLLEPADDASNVSKMMKILAARQTRFVNKRENRTGTLWEGRFKASLVDTDEYLLACYRYIDLNPVRAGLTSHPNEYHWSSYKDHSDSAVTSWLDDAHSFRELGSTRSDRCVAYRRLVEQSIPANQLRCIRSAVQRNQVTGSARFREIIERRTGRTISARAPGRPRKRKK